MNCLNDAGCDGEEYEYTVRMHAEYELFFRVYSDRVWLGHRGHVFFHHEIKRATLTIAPEGDCGWSATLQSATDPSQVLFARACDYGARWVAAVDDADNRDVSPRAAGPQGQGHT